MQKTSSTNILHSTAHLLLLLQPGLLSLLLGCRLGIVQLTLLRDSALLPPDARLLPAVDDLLLLLRLSNCTSWDVFQKRPHSLSKICNLVQLNVILPAQNDF